MVLSAQLRRIWNNRVWISGLQLSLQGFEIGDSKWLNGESKGNGFEFEKMENSAVQLYREVQNNRNRDKLWQPFYLLNKLAVYWPISLFCVLFIGPTSKQTKSTHHPLPPAPHTCSANRSLILFSFIFLLLLIRSFGYCVPSVWQITASNPRCWSSIVVKYYRLVSSLCHSQQRIVSAGLWPTWVYQICHILVI